MGEVYIICDDCTPDVKNRIKVKVNGADDLPNVKCPKCGSENIWFNEINIT